MRRRAFVGCATLAQPWLRSGSVRAQAAWPSRPLRIVVPFGAGGASDVAVRYLTEPLSAALGVPVVVENRTGAGGSIGTAEAIRAAPDGHTLVSLGNTTAANEHLQPGRGFVLMRDLTAVAPVNVANNVLAVHPSVPAQDLPELLAVLKREPGRWNYAHSGIGTPYHLAAEMLKAMGGVDAVAISFRGSNEARVAVISGQVPIMFDSVPTMAPQIASGQVRGLATTGAERDPMLPDLPTVAETLPGFSYPIWIGLMAPAATPRPVVERLHAEITAIMSAPAAREAMRRMGAASLVMTLPEYDAFLRREVTSMGELIRRAGVRPE